MQRAVQRGEGLWPTEALSGDTISNSLSCVKTNAFLLVRYKGEGKGGGLGRRMQVPGQLGVAFWQAEVFEEQQKNFRAEPKQFSCLAHFSISELQLSTTA